MKTGVQGQVVVHKGRIVSWKVSIQIVKLETNPENGGRVYTADCPLLHIASHGKTEMEARKSMQEMIKVYLEELLDMDTFEEVMTEYGWKKSEARKSADVKEVWHPPQMTLAYAMAGA